jgi:hypothetical protein
MSPSRDDSSITFSVVVPVRRATREIDRLHARLVAVAEGLGEPFEVIYVVDGGSKATAETCDALCRDDDRVRSVVLTRAFGPAASAQAGCQRSIGRAAICLDTLDGVDPSTIPSLVARWREGYEVVLPAYQQASPRGSSLRHAARTVAMRIGEALRGDDAPAGLGTCVLDRRALDLLSSRYPNPVEARDLARIPLRIARPPMSADRPGQRDADACYRLIATKRRSVLRRLRREPWRGLELAGLSLIAMAATWLVAMGLLWPVGFGPGGLAPLVALLTAVIGALTCLVGQLARRVAHLSRRETWPAFVVRRCRGFVGDRAAAPPPGASTPKSGIRLYT